jgi:membrane-bound lytic murein transglycosylase D
MDGVGMKGLLLVLVLVFNGELSAETLVEDSLIHPNDYRIPYDYCPNVRYETIQQRVKDLEREVPLHFNRTVKDFIDYFTIRNRDYTRRVISRSKAYFPIIEEHLAKHGLPDELKYLAIVESALYPGNRSSMGAAGLWQLMIPTARQYGLTINEYVDERMDPQKSTEAASKLLKWLYNSFGDWELALAAYNVGYGNVNKAIRKVGQRSFWSIYKHLPHETRSFVPQFVAFVYVMNHLEEHNFFVVDGYLPKTEELKVYGPLDLVELTNNMNYCLDDLKALNPHLRKDYIPSNKDGIKLTIPYDLTAFALLIYAGMLEINDPKEAVAQEKPPRVYIVAEGDSLWEISRRYDAVTIEGLKKLNGINGNVIQPGQKLILFE